MDQKPTCVCKGTEFTCESVQMPNNNNWCPVICKTCGAIVGQLPSIYEKETTRQVIGEISTILERLDNIQTILYNIEESSLKS